MKAYVKQILFIVFLTNIPAILTVRSNLGIAIGWFIGMFASSVNFCWLSFMISRKIDSTADNAGVKSFSGFYLRYLFLIAFSVFVVLFIKPNILAYGAGLISVQIAIYIHYAYNSLLKLSRKMRS